MEGPEASQPVSVIALTDDTVVKEIEAYFLYGVFIHYPEIATRFYKFIASSLFDRLQERSIFPLIET